MHSFLDVGAFVEKERVTRPYKFGTMREAHARASVERERNKQGSVKCVVILALRSTEEEKKRDCLLSRFGQMIVKIWCGSPFFSFFFSSRLFTKHMLQLQMLKLKESI